MKWSDILRPVQKSMIDSLASIFRDLDSTDTQRTVAVSVLTEYGHEDPELLASLIVDAKPQQFAIMISAMQKNRQQSVDSLRRQLEMKQTVYWEDMEADKFPVPSSNTIQSLESAGGLVSDHCAFCQRLPSEIFSAVAEVLSRSGYRPICYRPFVVENKTFVAAAWNRDGREWRINDGSKAETIRDENEEFRKQGLWPVDVAHFQSTTTGGQAIDQFAALWSARWPEISDAGMYVGVPEEEHPNAWGPFASGSFSNRTGLKIQDIHGRDLYSSVRWKMWREPRCHDCWNSPTTSYVQDATHGWAQSDVRIHVNTDDHSEEFTAVWRDGSEHETRELHGLSLINHLEKCRALLSEGFRPWSISVDTPNAGIAAASVWARPIDEDAKDALALHKATAAIALLRLGSEAELWRLLRLSADPRLRAILIDSLAEYDCPVALLLDRLQSEPEVDVRIALLLSLTSFDVKTIAPDRLKSALQMLKSSFVADPDPGIHSATDLLLRRWGADNLLAELNQEITGKQAVGQRWLLDGQGHTLAVVPGPVEFLMGSLPQTIDRNNGRETCHKKRIGRSFAIATREVTVQQFQRFQAQFNYAYNLSRDPQCPINNSDWFDAAQYCRWLSEEEGIPESEMCFPPIEEIKVGMRLPKDYLNRTGYRLPTETEWEYSCRAGTETERYFGQTDLLLNKHAWTNRNSAVDEQYQLWPVGLLRPNDLGLFDMLGNVMELCQEANTTYPEIAQDYAINDVDTNLTVTNDVLRPVRGGAFLYQPSNARAGHRDNNRYPDIGSLSPYMGFRVARTIQNLP